MKILILANHEVSIYNFRRELIEAMLTAGHEVHLSLPYGPKLDVLIAMGCEFTDAPLDRRGTSPLADSKLLLFYLRLAKRVKPDVMLTFAIKPNIYGGIVSRILKIPCLCNVTGLGTAIENKGFMQTLTLTLYRIAFKNKRQVFFQNQQNLDLFVQKKIVKVNYRLLPGSGVNLKFFIPLDYLPGDTTEFVYIGRVMQAKGIDEYLAAAQAIRIKFPNTRFHICGFCEQDYDDTLKQLQQKGIVTYHDVIHDVRDILAYTHCTVLPSHHEGMANTLLESAAAARPIIATDIPGCREVVADGVSGYLHPKGENGTLIKKLEQFITLPWTHKREMGLAGRRLMERYFDRNIVVDAYMQEIEALKNYNGTF